MKCACKSLVLFGCVCPLICSGSLWSFISQSKANTLLLKWSMLLGIKYLISLASSALCFSPWPMAKLYDLSPRAHIRVPASCKSCAVWFGVRAPATLTMPSQGQGSGDEAGWALMVMNPWQKRSVCLLYTRVWQSAWTCMDLEKLWSLKSCVTNRTETWVSCTRARAKFSSSERSGSCMPAPVFCCVVRGLRANLLPSAESWDMEIFCSGWMRVWSWAGGSHARKRSDKARWCIRLLWNSHISLPCCFAVLIGCSFQVAQTVMLLLFLRHPEYLKICVQPWMISQK